MSRPSRLPAFDYIGHHRYFLTICTHERRPLFSDEATVSLVHAQILYQSKDDDFELTAYCYMPDHFHLLATGTTEAADLKRFMHTTKQRSAWHFSRAEGRRLWQEGYYDRVLRDEESTPAVVEYIVNNPVRAKLVERPLEYPHWGSSRFSREELLEFIGACHGWHP